jgi:hypothetical protein
MTKLRAAPKHIGMWLIERLVPWAKNPRTHSDAQVAQIAASIEEFGFNNPILVDTKAGIIAGAVLCLEWWPHRASAHGNCNPYLMFTPFP